MKVRNHDLVPGALPVWKSDHQRFARRGGPEIAKPSDATDSHPVPASAPRFLNLRHTSAAPSRPLPARNLGPHFPGIEPTAHLAASQSQHHYVQYLAVPKNGFRATTVAVTPLWEEPAGHHSGRHKHLEAVVCAYDGEGYTELEGYTSQRIPDEFGRPIVAGKNERLRERK